MNREISVTMVEACWRKTIAAEYKGHFTAPLTFKQRGQLKHCIKVCPHGSVLDVVKLAVRDWSTFISRAKVDAGAFSLPSMPCPGFLTKYIGVAVNHWLETTTKPRLPSSEGKPKTLSVNHIAVPKAAPIPPKDEAASWEEVQEILEIE